MSEQTALEQWPCVCADNGDFTCVYCLMWETLERACPEYPAFLVKALAHAFRKGGHAGALATWQAAFDTADAKANLAMADGSVCAEAYQHLANIFELRIQAIRQREEK